MFEGLNKDVPHSQDVCYITRRGILLQDRMSHEPRKQHFHVGSFPCDFGFRHLHLPRRCANIIQLFGRANIQEIEALARLCSMLCQFRSDPRWHGSCIVSSKGLVSPTALNVSKPLESFALYLASLGHSWSTLHHCSLETKPHFSPWWL